MKIIKNIILLMIIVFIPFNVVAADNYITDNTKSLNKLTIDKVNNDLGKSYDKTGILAKINIVQSLDGKDIETFARDYAKNNINNEKYILFTISIKDRKNNVLVGSSVGDIVSKAQRDNLSSVPNSYFKVGNFDKGVLEVKDQMIDLLNPTDWLLIIFTIIVGIILIYILYRFIKKKVDKDYERRKREFATANNLDIEEKDDSFHTASMNKSSDNTIRQSSGDMSNLEYLKDELKKESYTIKDRRVREPEPQGFYETGTYKYDKKIPVNSSSYGSYGFQAPVNSYSTHNTSNNNVNIVNIDNSHKEEISRKSSYSNSPNRLYDSSSDSSSSSWESSSKSSYDYDDTSSSSWGSSSDSSSNSYDDSGSSSSDW